MFDPFNLEGMIVFRTEMQHTDTALEMVFIAGKQRVTLYITEMAAKGLRNQLNAHLSQMANERNRM